MSTGREATSNQVDLLRVEGLVTEISTGESRIRVVDDVSIHIKQAEIVGLVGESGCGKSMTALSIMGLFPTAAARITRGQVLLNGIDLVGRHEHELRRIRGRQLGMIFQDPSTYLDPLMPVGRQIAMPMRIHGEEQQVQTRVYELLDLMGFNDPRGTARRYPHQLSGGQRQRVLIATALALRPSLLIADEPTTALDVTVQDSILTLLTNLRDELGLAVLLITHDLGVIAETCNRAYVMYAGRVVETGPVYSLFEQPRHPYTSGLLRSTLGLEEARVELFSMRGMVPDLASLPSGCRFHPRCPAAIEACRTEDPEMVMDGPSGDACLRSGESDVRELWEV